MTPTTITFVVPGHVLPWKRTVSAKNGHRYTPQAQRDYQAHVKACAWAELAKRGWLSTWPANGRYAIDVEARVADYRVLDMDNCAKQVGDSCQGLLWINDARVDDQRSRRFVVPENLGLTVRVDVLVAVWSSQARASR